MDSRVDKEVLLEKVRENRAAHRKIFEEAVEGYKSQAVQILEEHIERIKSGSLVRVYVSLPEPEDHTGDYDRVIAMIEMNEEGTIVLDENTFARYVMDDWQWKQQFLQTNSAYSVTAAAEIAS